MCDMCSDGGGVAGIMHFDQVFRAYWPASGFFCENVFVLPFLNICDVCLCIISGRSIGKFF